MTEYRLGKYGRIYTHDEVVSRTDAPLEDLQKAWEKLPIIDVHPEDRLELERKMMFIYEEPEFHITGPAVYKYQLTYLSGVDNENELYWMVVL